MLAGEVAAREPWFTDVTEASGIAFRHQEGTLLRYLPQVTGAGVAVLDYDGDGVLDVFLVQGAGPADRAGPAGEVGPGARLYRGTGDGRFADVTDAAGIDARGSGMAVLACDRDGDGWTDLLVSFHGRPVAFFDNRGDGTFARSDGPAGAWDSCLTALDYDRDGQLDLFLGQYARFERAAWTATPAVVGQGQALELSTLLPGRYAGLPARLLHARGDGGYADRTAADGVGEVATQALGALAADLDGDGWVDLVIAADGHTHNRVLKNAGGRFVDVSRASFGDEMRGAMGLAFRPPDLAITHWLNATAFYRVSRQGRGSPALRDLAAPAGLTAGRPGVGWGVGFIDVDQDGREDLLEIRGGAAPSPDEPWSGRLERQTARLWHDAGGGRFELEAPAGDADVLARPRVGRGAAFGDLDRDGAVDVVVTSNNGPAEVWRAAAPRAAWIALDAVGTDSSRDPIGAELAIGERRKPIVSGDSYFSSSARAVTFGLGAADAPVEVRVRWPRGRVESFGPLATRRRHRLVEGAGRDMK